MCFNFNYVFIFCLNKGNIYNVGSKMVILMLISICK